jgi:hypothetical protein
LKKHQSGCRIASSPLSGRRKNVEFKTLKPKFGRWLTIEELRGFLAEMPDEVFQKVPINRKLLERASEFVETQKGWWEHPDWESFLDRLSKDGFQLSKEVEPPIGNILEIFKEYYHAGRFQAITEKRRKAAATRKARSSSHKQAVKHA